LTIALLKIGLWSRAEIKDGVGAARRWPTIKRKDYAYEGLRHSVELRELRQSANAVEKRP
jgi:hypothetical protein